MKSITAAEDVSGRSPAGSLGEHAIGVPRDHVGPYFVAGLGRMIWWTGRVAIGLRYDPLRNPRPAGGGNVKL